MCNLIEVSKLCAMHALLLSLNLKKWQNINLLINARQTQGLKWGESCMIGMSRLHPSCWVHIGALPSKLATSLAERCILIDLDSDLSRLCIFQAHGAFSAETARSDAIFWGRKVRSGALPWCFFQRMCTRGMLAADALTQAHFGQALNMCLSAFERKEGVAKGFARRQWRFARQCALTEPRIAYEIAGNVTSRWINENDFSFQWQRRVERYLLRCSVSKPGLGQAVKRI